MKGQVHCDTCHDEFDSDDLAQWHDKACQKCGASPLVSDVDLALIRLHDTLEAMGLVTQEKTDKPSIGFRINTAGLRK